MSRDDWNQHWEDFSKMALLNPANQYRTQLILKHLSYDTHVHILDIGSGQGLLVSKLLSHCKGATISGIDISEIGILCAKEKNPDANFFQMNLLDLPQRIPEGLLHNVDVAICTEVLEHLDDPVLFLKNIKIFLKPNASLIITVPGGIRSAYDKYLGHRRHFTKKSLIKLLHAAEFTVDKIEAAGFPFFNLYKLLIFFRGKKMIHDAKKINASFSLKFLSKIFSLLFRLNLSHSYFGWQWILVAKNEGISHE